MHDGFRVAMVCGPGRSAVGPQCERYSAAIRLCSSMVSRTERPQHSFKLSGSISQHAEVDGEAAKWGRVILHRTMELRLHWISIRIPIAHFWIHLQHAGIEVGGGGGGPRHAMPRHGCPVY